MNLSSSGCISHLSHWREPLCLESPAQGLPCLKLQEQLYLIAQPDGSALVLDAVQDYLWQTMNGEVSPLNDHTPMTETAAFAGMQMMLRASPEVIWHMVFDENGNVALDGEAPAAVRILSLRQDVYLLSFDAPCGHMTLLLDACAVRCAGHLAPQGLLFSAYGGFEKPEKPLGEFAYKHRTFGVPIYNPVAEKPSPGGLSQYVYPPTSEVEGTEAHFYFQGTEDISLRILDGKQLLWRCGSEWQQRAHTTYKVAEDAYMTLVPFLEKPLPTLYTLAWSKNDDAVTVVVSTIGEYRDYPRMVRSTPYFGAKNAPCRQPAHHLTDELTGKRIYFQYTPNDAVLHIYPHRERHRMAINIYHLAEDAPEEVRQNYERRLANRKYYPFYEEYAFYVKLRKGLYLYSVIEGNSYHMVPGEMGGGELMAVLDAKRERYIGRTFGVNGDKPSFDTVGAQGLFLSEPDEAESYPCPYYPDFRTLD